MNIVMLTAGTGSFYCGTCLRDDALARGLVAQGHDVRLVPLYLPLVTEREGSDERVLLGGVSAYLQQRSALCRALPAWVDRALDSPAMLAMAAKRAGATNPVALGPMTLSMLAGSEGNQAKGIRRLCEALLEGDPPPQAVILSNALLIGLAAPLKEALGCPVVCTLQGEDAFLDALPEGARQASWALCAGQAKAVDHFIAVSAYHRDVMHRRLNLSDAHVHVVHNGIELDGMALAEVPPERPTLGYLARMCAEKGLPVLVEAYIQLRASWDTGPAPALLLGGALTELDKPVLGAAIKRLTEAGVADHLEVHPNMSRAEKLAFLRRLSVMCVPVQVSESFGLYALEAMACGVPIVAPDQGGLKEVLAATGGGVLSRDASAEAVAAALFHLLVDPPRAQALGAQGRRAVFEGFSVQQMAQGVEGVLSEALQ